jgi:uncharacterized protein (TIGR03435 family)
VALLAICTSSVLYCEDQPKFETASVKRIDRGVIHNSMGPGTVTLRGDPLKIILMEAFQVKTYQVVGPGWLDEDCFEIVAKMPEGATSDQIPAMLRALLVERFHLAARKENQPHPVYALVVDKGGPKFKDASLNFRSIGLRPGQVMFRAATDTTGFKGSITMARLAHFLSGKLDRPVQDFTGLTGTYDIDLAWTPDPTIDRPSPQPSAFAEAGSTSPADPKPTLFTAIRESLGLKLEPRREPVEMLVIDRVDRIPTEN